MATLILAAAGAAIGSGVGGAVLGLSGAVIGQAVGATIGQAVDQRLMSPASGPQAVMGAGSQVIESGRLDRLQLNGASEGAPVPLVWGRVRLGGQVIWSSRFQENVEIETTGGEDGQPLTELRRYSYSISLAIALCEGPIRGVGRIWADGEEIAPADLDLRVHTGSEDQLPDPKIAAVEGEDRAPAYRGIAYVVLEEFDLGPFGNRVPQLSFEVLRAAASEAGDAIGDVVRAVALMPGTGDYALATSRVHFPKALGRNAPGNTNTPLVRTDLEVSLDALEREAPRARSALLVASWFGDDLRAGACSLRPMVENAGRDGFPRQWGVSGRLRPQAAVLPTLDGRPVYGSTPADSSVRDAIAEMTARGIDVVFYPFILMTQLAGNGLPDPWSDAPDQPVLPWRGRITTDKAPGRPGSPDGTAAAEAEVAAFFGTVGPQHFQVAGGQVFYNGPAGEWSYRRFILHYAALCKAAGGVHAFCIGSEMRALTQIRGPGNSFPAVAALRALAVDVRAILGPDVKLTYAADWSEYWGHTDAEGNRFFHLDPLWADPEIDFIGIDNYMPLSDWREGDDHADAHWGSIYNLDYLMANVAGGEGYDWFYPSDAHRRAQARMPITDGAHHEPWIWRTKDLRSWWQNDHHERVGGVRAAQPTAWVPRSKPIWFTELGCAAIDKGTNQPNKFLDPKSSESSVPYFSNGRRDDTIQMQYLRAMHRYWEDPAHNPVSELYDGPMVDMARAHVWAWDARPYPWFPANLELWADGENWERGHWITGRTLSQPLSAVVAEICARAGVGPVDTSALQGVVRGYAPASTDSARAMLQPLMLAHGIEAVERAGVLVFRLRATSPATPVGADDLAARDGGALELARAPEAERIGRVAIGYIEAGGDFATRSTEARFPDARDTVSTQSDLAMVLAPGEARLIAERWLAEARVARDSARLSLPPSRAVAAGDVLAIEGGAGAGLYRVDRLARTGAQEIEATRVEPGVYAAAETEQDRVALARFSPPLPVLPVFMDLPLMRGDDSPHAPWLAVAADPWPGVVAAYKATLEGEFARNRLFEAPAVVGETETPLDAVAAGRWDRGPALRLRLAPGAQLASVGRAALLDGANLMAIGNGAVWELLQFRSAQMLGEDVWEVSNRLRGRFGTEGVMPSVWPPGSTVVLMNGAPRQIALARAARGLARRYRIGPAARPVSDPAYTEATEAFDGVGLRPYAPAHLRAHALPGGDVAVSWVRRTRVDGDDWQSYEVPLAEEFERYRVQVFDPAMTLRREAEVSTPGWTYTAAMQASDGLAAPWTLAVAQISAAFGPGPARRLLVAD